MKPLDLIGTARRLSQPASGRRPRDSDLRRAVSTAYYAVFHALCENCANCMIGTKAADRSEPAWTQAYRAIEHRYSKNQCSNQRIMAEFPREIVDLANIFKDLQFERHRADYDPNARFRLADTVALIDQAEIAIKDFGRSPVKHRRAFAAWTAMKARND